MPFPGTIFANKDSANPPRPLLLAVFTLVDGTVKRYATHAVTYSGNAYEARILDQDIGAIQALADSGIDEVPQVTLHLADADAEFWTYIENPIGLKGAQLDLKLVLWQLGTSNFSTDSLLKFRGICSPPNLDESVGAWEITATNKLNLQRKLLPILPVEPRCPWNFPTTAAQRLDGAENSDSPFFRCGYSADQSGPNARGNGSFTSCDYTKQACQARGMYSKDSANRVTGRFGGVQWDPPLAWRSKSYLDGKTIEGINSSNLAKYKQYVPLAYGTVMLTPVIANVIGDGNSTRFEAIVCAAFNGPANIISVIVNDVLIPYAPLGGPRQDVLFAWYYVNQGGRTGKANTDKGWTDTSGNPLGDPYGSMCTIGVVVHKSLADSASIPNVKVILQGPAVHVWASSGPTDYTLQVTDNLAWVMADLLAVQGPYLFTDIDLQTVLDYSAVCGAQINHMDLSGATSLHSRYSTSLAIGDRRSLAEVIRNLRRAGKLQIVPNGPAGLLQFFGTQTLAAQQPAPIAGSNTSTAVSSKTALGATANGYPAFAFTDRHILKVNGKSTLRITQRSLNDSPNRVGFAYQDIENQSVTDSITRVDTIDVGRCGGQEIAATLPIDGINNYADGANIIETGNAETYRGNFRADSGGTLTFTFQTSGLYVSHLRVGHICTFSYQRLQIANQLVRLVSIKPSSNHEIATVSLQFHYDEWYVDGYGVDQTPYFSSPSRQTLSRPPLGWQPFIDHPLSSDPLFDPTEFTFGLAVNYDTAADGSAIAEAVVRGRLPANTLNMLQPPQLGLQGTTANTGGSIPGGSILYAVVVPSSTATDVPQLGAVQRIPCTITIPSGTDTNTATVPVPFWPAASDGYRLYAGRNPNRLTQQVGGTGNPSSIEFDSLNVRTQGLPDPVFDHLQLDVKRVLRSGIGSGSGGTQIITALTDTTITVDGAGWTVNGWAGRTISVLARAASNVVPVWDFKILSNTIDTLTVVSGTPALLTVAPGGLAVGDTFTIRLQPDTFTATTIGDSQLSLTSNADAGNLIRIIAGTGRGQIANIVSNTTGGTYTIEGQFDPTPDATSVFIVEEQAPQTTVKTQSTKNSDPTVISAVNVDISNFSDQTLLLIARTVDSAGNACFPQDCPIRDFYLAGSTGANPNGPSAYSW